MCQLADVTCQTTGRCVRRPAWNETPGKNTLCLRQYCYTVGAFPIPQLNCENNIYNGELFHCILLSIWCKCIRILPRWQTLRYIQFNNAWKYTDNGYWLQNNMPSRINVTFCSNKVFLISTSCTCSHMPSFRHIFFSCSEISKLFNWYYNCAIYKESNKNFHNR